MIQSILSNLAVILLGHLLMTLLVSVRTRLSKMFFSTLVVLLFSSVIIIMFYLPININGFKFDMRAIPLIFLAFFRGWRITFATLAVTATWRYFMGGVGMAPGILFGMIGPTVFTLLYIILRKNVSKFADRFIIITACWFISDFPIIYIIPNGWEVFKDIFFIRYSSFIVVSFTYYTFIKFEHKKEFYKTQLERMAYYDQLTNLFNRRKFLDLMEVKKKTDNPHQYLALLDIDYFKNINDTYGHHAGDQVLIQIATILNQKKDFHFISARYGGEEFIMYLQAATADEAIHYLKKLQQQITQTNFYLNETDTIQLTVSIGLAQFELDASLNHIIHVADSNLYKAKQQGRNCLITSIKEA